MGRKKKKVVGQELRFVFTCEACNISIEKFMVSSAKKPKKCPNCGKHKLNQEFSTNVWSYLSPKTFGQQGALNAKSKSKEELQLMFENEPVTKQRKEQVKNIPWFRSGKVPGTERMDKALDISKIKDTRKYIETGEKD